MLVLIHIIALLSHYCNVFAITAYSILTITQFGLQINPLLTKMYFQLHNCKNTSTYMCTSYGIYNNVTMKKKNLFFFDKPFLFGGNVQSPKMIVWFLFEGGLRLDRHKKMIDSTSTLYFWFLIWELSQIISQNQKTCNYYYYIHVVFLFKILFLCDLVFKISIVS